MPYTFTVTALITATRSRLAAVLASTSSKLAASLLLAGFGIAPSASALEVVTSIKPVQLLVATISDGVNRPQLLIPGASSPHDFQLRPSERIKLEQAELIFWIGPELEMSLTKVLRQLPTSVRVVSLMDQPQQPTTVPSQHPHHDEHQHDSDPHIWLDPERAKDLAQRITEVLSEVDPDNGAHYRQNLTLFLDQLDTTDRQIQELLVPVQKRGYFVFHDGYQGFEQHYGLNHLGAFTLSPERRPGAKHLAHIRQQLSGQRAVCVFSEPQFSPDLVENLIEATETRQGQLDPMAATIEADAQGYLNLLRQLGQSFERCLSGHSTSDNG